MCEPVCELFFRDFARGQCPKLQYAFLSRRSQLKSVQTEKCHGNSECGSLVSIDKWTVRNYSCCIAGGESRQRGSFFRIREDVFGPSKRRLEKAHIAHSLGPAMELAPLVGGVCQPFIHNAVETGALFDEDLGEGAVLAKENRL